MTSWRLERYYFAIQISGIVTLLFFGLAAWLFPHHFIFFGENSLFLKLVFGWLMYHVFFFVAHVFTENRIYFSLSRYGWIGFFISIILVSGGTNSHLLYLLIFPLLVAGVDLDAKDIKITGGIVSGFFVWLFVRDQILFGYEGIGLRMFNLAVFTIISIYIYVLVTDTIRSRSEKEKIKAELENIVTFDRVKRDFIAVASHQLRTPLSRAKWAIEESGDTEEAKHLIDDSIEVINELLKTLEYNERDIKLIKKSTNLHELMKKILADLAPFARMKKVSLDLSGGLESKAFVDSGRLEIALHHLVENAIKYSPGGKVEIRIDYTEEGSMINIIDNGIGIHKEDMPHIFEQFFRAQNAVRIEPNASGIGLYTAKKIIEGHGGKIKIDSEYENGTRVEVTL